MNIMQDPKTGFWNLVTLRTHAADACIGPLCDVHNRRGPEPQASWPLLYRTDRGIMEVICPHGIGHPTAAQRQFWDISVASGKKTRSWADAEAVHGCDGCC